MPVHYSRFGNPTVMAIEDKIAKTEGGVGAMCTTSGQAAILLSLLNICEAGDGFVSTTAGKAVSWAGACRGYH